MIRAANSGVTFWKLALSTRGLSVQIQSRFFSGGWSSAWVCADLGSKLSKKMLWLCILKWWLNLDWAIFITQITNTEKFATKKVELYVLGGVFHSGPELRITVLYSLVLGYKWYQKDLNGGRDQGYHQWSPILCHKQGWISKSWTLGRNISTIWVVMGISRIQSWLWWLASFLLFTYQTHPTNQQSPAFW